MRTEISFSGAYGLLGKMDSILGYKTGLVTFEIIEIIYSLMTVELNWKSILVIWKSPPPNDWKLSIYL